MPAIEARPGAADAHVRDEGSNRAHGALLHSGFKGGRGWSAPAAVC